MLEDIIIRPVRAQDLDDLYEMSGIAQAGLTNFPHDEQVLAKLIAKSEQSFANPSKQTGHFLFALEHVLEKRVIGISGIISQVGLDYPAFYYDVEMYKTASSILQRYSSYSSIHLKSYEGALSEVCSLYLRPEYRRAGIGRLLSLHRFMYMGLFSDYFNENVIAEMRGLSNKDGVSPFYSTVWEERLNLSFSDANRKVLDYPGMVVDLGHRHPIELSFLPHWVRDVIAQPHPKTAPAYALLSSIGFEYAGKVCVLDAGPVLEAKLDSISVIKSMFKTKDWYLMEDLELDTMKAQCLVLVSNGKSLDYRCGIAAKVGSQVVLTPQLSSYLGVFPGDTLVVSMMYV